MPPLAVSSTRNKRSTDVRAPIVARGSSSRTRTVRAGSSMGDPVRVRVLAEPRVDRFPPDVDGFFLAFFRGVVPALATALARPRGFSGCSFASPDAARFAPVYRLEELLLCFTFVTP